MMSTELKFQQGVLFLYSQVDAPTSKKMHCKEIDNISSLRPMLGSRVTTVDLGRENEEDMFSCGLAEIMALE